VASRAISQRKRGRFISTGQPVPTCPTTANPRSFSYKKKRDLRVLCTAFRPGYVLVACHDFRGVAGVDSPPPNRPLRVETSPFRETAGWGLLELVFVAQIWGQSLAPNSPARSAIHSGGLVIWGKVPRWASSLVATGFNNLAHPLPRFANPCGGRVGVSCVAGLLLGFHPRWRSAVGRG